MVEWHIGCSGFHYKHWKGIFYPEDLPQKRWFEYYSQYFNTLELNVTFYRFPQLSFLNSWYDRSPETFKFAVKAPRAITHYKKFTGVTDMLGDFYKTVREGLKEKLGCVLFQMPPNYHYSADKLNRIVDQLDNSFINVLEFRHNSWWNQDVYNALARSHISFCGMSHPSLPPDVVTNSDHVYFRFHGNTQLYESEYSLTELTDFKNKVLKGHQHSEVFVYFNNDIHGHAIKNARQLVDLVSSRKLKQGT